MDGDRDLLAVGAGGEDPLDFAAQRFGPHPGQRVGVVADAGAREAEGGDAKPASARTRRAPAMTAARSLQRGRFGVSSGGSSSRGRVVVHRSRKDR